MVAVRVIGWMNLVFIVSFFLHFERNAAILPDIRISISFFRAIIAVVWLIDIVFMIVLSAMVIYTDIFRKVPIKLGVFQPYLFGHSWFVILNVYKRVKKYNKGVMKNLDSIIRYADEWPKVEIPNKGILGDLSDEKAFNKAVALITTAKVSAEAREKRQDRATKRQSEKERHLIQLRERSARLGISEDEFNAYAAGKGPTEVAFWLDEVVIRRRLEERKAAEAIEQQRREEQRHQEYLDGLQTKAEGISSDPNIREECLGLVEKLRVLEKGLREYRMTLYAFNTKLAQLKT
ncbi:hypothetical protein HN958_02410 [Candidatus Falkowbacteria bacterium]|nr:hypothetical protein [Candidatus Falkowbacteria bacterium]